MKEEPSDFLNVAALPEAAESPKPVEITEFMDYFISSPVQEDILACSPRSTSFPSRTLPNSTDGSFIELKIEDYIWFNLLVAFNLVLASLVA